MHVPSSSDVLLVDGVSVIIIDYAEDEKIIFIATVCKQWRRSWGQRPLKTNAITTSTSESHLKESVESDVSLYRLCSYSAALERKYLIEASGKLGAPWINAMPQAAKLNNLSLVKFMRQLGCPMSANVLEVFSYKGNLEAMQYLIQSGCPHGRCLAYAAATANLRTLRWLRNNGTPLDTDSFAACCTTGSVEAIKWFERNLSAWDPRVFPFACRSGNLEAVQLLFGLGYVATSQATTAAAGLESMDVLV